MTPENFESKYAQMICDELNATNPIAEIPTIEKYGYIAHVVEMEIPKNYRDGFAYVAEMIRDFFRFGENGKNFYVPIRLKTHAEKLDEYNQRIAKKNDDDDEFAIITPKNFDAELKRVCSEIANQYNCDVMEFTFGNSYGMSIHMDERQILSVAVIRKTSDSIVVNIDYPRTENYATNTHTIDIHTFDVCTFYDITSDVDNAIFHILNM